MKKLMTALALSAIVAGPLFALDNKEKQDLNKVGKDAVAAGADDAKARDHYKRAGAARTEAHKHWQAANAAWATWHHERQEMIKFQREAAGLQNEANKLHGAAEKLRAAEQKRALAFDDRLQADRLEKAAASTELDGRNAEAEAKQIDVAVGALASIKDPKLAKDVEDMRKRASDMHNLAKTKMESAAHDRKVAGEKLAHAGNMEKEANALEHPVAPPPAIVVKAPPPVAKIVVAVPPKK
jgi:hypothetical protein